MSGFEGIAAIIGVVDISLKSVIGLYNFVSELKSIPAELERLRREIKLFFECLRPLDRRLTKLDNDGKASILNTGLRQAVEACSQACEQLQADLSHWSPASNTSVWSRLIVQAHKKKIEAATAEVFAAKQAVILAAVVVNL
jgi:hypothetical protein